MSMINYNSGCKCYNKRLSKYDACNFGQPGIIKTIQQAVLHGCNEEQFLNFMNVNGIDSNISNAIGIKLTLLLMKLAF